MIQKEAYFFEQYIQDTVNCKFHYNEFSYKQNRPIKRGKLKFQSNMQLNL